MKASIRFGLWFVLAAALLAALPVMGQSADLSEVYTFDSGTTFRHPAGVEVEVNDRTPGFAHLALDKGEVYVSDYAVFERSEFAEDAPLEDAASWYSTWISGITFDANRAKSTTLGEREALTYAYQFDGKAWLLVLVRFDDGGFGAVDGGSKIDSTVLSMAATLGTDPDAEPVAIDFGCTVSTPDEKSAQLRVGPGTNRTVFAFLPAKTDFTPLGRAEADDGSIWFQMDKDEVAPKSAVNEAWIAAEDVDTSGNCDIIGEASAPPIVPIVAAPPASSGGDSGSSGGSTASIAPSPGTWTMSYASRGKGSCLDAADFTYDFSVGWQSSVVSLSYTGSTVILSGNRLAQVAPNVYSGIFTLSNGNSFELVISPVSPTQFSGEAHLTGVVEGHTCSNTVGVTLTKN